MISKPSIAYEPPSTITKPDRLLSLDLLRGLTIVFMILVNNNGSATVPTGRSNMRIGTASLLPISSSLLSSFSSASPLFFIEIEPMR